MDTLETTPPSNGSTGEKTLSASPAAGVPRATRPAIEILKVSATSNPKAVAGAIAGGVRSQTRGEVQANGAGVSNQAIKRLVLSRGPESAWRLAVGSVPSYCTDSTDGRQLTGPQSV